MIRIIKIAISLVIVIGLATGCGMVASTYPADISGHVIIAEKLKQATAIPIPPSDESEVFWVVGVTVKNNSYPEPIEASYFDGGWTAWRMTANGEIYVPRYVPGEPLSIPIGETYSFMTYFVVPQDLEIGDAQIRYTGQDPYSYGSLGGGERVVSYDWDSKEVLQEVEVVPELNVADMWGLLSNVYAIIFVQLEATPTTKVGYYNIELQAGNESFVSKRVFWGEGMELMTLDWQISYYNRAWAELSRGKKPIDVFQVDISYEPY